MKRLVIIFVLTNILAISCEEPNLPETSSSVPMAKLTLKSSVITSIPSWKANYITELATNGSQIAIGYLTGLYTTVNLKKDTNVLPAHLSSFNFHNKQLLEIRTGMYTRSGADEKYTIQLLDTLEAFQAVKADNYVVATGLFTKGRYLLYDIENKSVSFHVSYPSHPSHPNIDESTKAILYASTVLKVRPDNQMFVCADMYSGNIEFCRITDGSIDRLNAHCYHHPRVYISKDEIPDVAYSRDNRFGFTDITVTAEKVYAIYSGRTYRNNRKTFQQCRTLMVFDWEGHLLHTYALDVPLVKLTFNTKENALYAIKLEPTSSLVKIQMPANNITD